MPGPHKRSWIGCFEQSVAEHLLSDVPLGVWLSGGIDSSTLLHYAAEASASRLKTFSITFRGRSFDETALHPRQVAQRYGTDAHTSWISSASRIWRERLRTFAYYSDEPNADSGALPVWFLSQIDQAARNRCAQRRGRRRTVRRIPDASRQPACAHRAPIARPGARFRGIIGTAGRFPTTRSVRIQS